MKSNQVTRSQRAGFTLPELLVSMTILLVLMTLLAAMLGQVQKTWTNSEGRISQFREARVAFDIISKNLAQASLNTYWDYDYDADGQVTEYRRQSELHFVSFNKPEFANSDGEVLGHSVFFQAPLGYSSQFRNLSNLYNARGYYVMHGSDRPFRPSFVESAEKYRFRLMEYFPPSEENMIYNDGDQDRLAERDPEYQEWWKYKIEEYSHPLAENIIALVVSPRESLDSQTGGGSAVSSIAEDYIYDSSDVGQNTAQQVPPLVRVTLIAIDETSAVQLETQYGDGVPPLETTSLFTNTGSYQGDIETLKASLDDKRLSYKVFNTAIGIRSSKWSNNEFN